MEIGNTSLSSRTDHPIVLRERENLTVIIRIRNEPRNVWRTCCFPASWEEDSGKSSVHRRAECLERFQRACMYSGKVAKVVPWAALVVPGRIAGGLVVEHAKTILFRLGRRRCRRRLENVG